MQGVITYSLSLFFCKLVAYTFLFWLPNYINTSKRMNHVTPSFEFNILTSLTVFVFVFCAAEFETDASTSAYLSSFFDIGGIFG